MWNKRKRKRFQILCQSELEGTLTDAEGAELSQMIAEIEETEAASLRPAIERMQDEREEIEAQNRALKTLVQRKEAFLTRLHVVLDELEVEQQAINEEFVRIIGKSPTANTGVSR